MSSPSLSKIWSIDVSAGTNAASYIAHFTAPAPTSGFDAWFVNNISMYRWGAQWMSGLLAIIPSSEARLRNEGVGALYAYIHSTIGTLKDTARNRGLTVPPFPEIPADWREDAMTGPTALQAALLPHASGPLNDYIGQGVELLTAKTPYHWTSPVAPVAVTAEMYVGVMETMKGFVGDKTLVPFAEAMTHNEVTGPVNVIIEEVLKIRSKAETTGWREEEAKTASVENMRLMKAFFESASN